MNVWNDLSARLRDPGRTLIGIKEFSQTLRARPDDRPEEVRNKIEGNDEICHYYRFLHELVKVTRAETIVETGTRLGCSALQMAYGNLQAKVVTIDIDPNVSARIGEFKIPNITPILGDSISVFGQVEAIAPTVDLIYLDSEHSFGRILAEYVVYNSLVKNGGLIIVDDIEINADLKRFWSLVRYPKTELNHLHTGFGFGIAIKLSEMSPL